MEHKQSEQLELTTESFYNLQNIYEVILELGHGDFTIDELTEVIENLFPDFTYAEQKDLGLKVLKIITIIN